MATILVIDDDEATRRVLARALNGRGHRALEANGGKSGVATALREQPALVITDIVIPDQEGIETIGQLRSLVPAPAIIAMSGLRGEAGFTPLEDARLLGADAVFQKPFDIEALLTEVDALLGRGAADGGD